MAAMAAWINSRKFDRTIIYYLLKKNIVKYFVYFKEQINNFKIIIQNSK